MEFGNEFWLVLFREYISPKLFAVRDGLRKRLMAKFEAHRLVTPTVWVKFKKYLKSHPIKGRHEQF